MEKGYCQDRCVGELERGRRGEKRKKGNENRVEGSGSKKVSETRRVDWGLQMNNRTECRVRKFSGWSTGEGRHRRHSSCRPKRKVSRWLLPRHLRCYCYFSGPVWSTGRRSSTRNARPPRLLLVTGRCHGTWTPCSRSWEQHQR